MAKFLVEECGAQVNPLDRWGFTPLQDAVRSGRSALVTYLQSKGAHNGTAPYTGERSQSEAQALHELPLLWASSLRWGWMHAGLNSPSLTSSSLFGKQACAFQGVVSNTAMNGLRSAATFASSTLPHANGAISFFLFVRDLTPPCGSSDIFSAAAHNDVDLLRRCAAWAGREFTEVEGVFSTRQQPLSSPSKTDASGLVAARDPLV
eukprot:3326134-Pleurochrysis_carterae.AAC.4